MYAWKRVGIEIAWKHANRLFRLSRFFYVLFTSPPVLFYVSIRVFLKPFSITTKNFPFSTNVSETLVMLGCHHWPAFGTMHVEPPPECLATESIYLFILFWFYLILFDFIWFYLILFRFYIVYGAYMLVAYMQPCDSDTCARAQVRET